MAAHPFEHGLHPRYDERLAAYLAEAVGGPALYTAGFRRATMIQRAYAEGAHLVQDDLPFKHA